MNTMKSYTGNETRQGLVRQYMMRAAMTLVMIVMTLTTALAQDESLIKTLTGKKSCTDDIILNKSGIYILCDLTITGGDRPYPGLTIDGKNVHLILEGKNKIKGGRHCPGIWVKKGCTLTISGSGSLEVEGGNSAPGIGGQYIGNKETTNPNLGKMNCGDIIINGGTIKAKGGSNAPSIGTRSPGTCGDITINGGTISAAYIGSRYKYSLGVTTIGKGITEIQTMHKLTNVDEEVKIEYDKSNEIYTLTGDGTGQANSIYYFTGNINLHSTVFKGLSVIHLGDGAQLEEGSDNITVHIQDGATVILDDGIRIDNDNNPGIICEGDATIILQGEEESKDIKVNGGKNSPGIFVPKGHTLTIRGDGKLKAKGSNKAPAIGGYGSDKGGNVIIESGAITANGGYYGIKCGGTVTVKNTAKTVELYGSKCALYAEDLILEGVEGNYMTIFKPTTGIFNASYKTIQNDQGESATSVTIGSSSSPTVPLWIGQTQVIMDNADDILGDGTASYDVAAETLTLRNPNITGTDNKIYANGINLTVKGSYNMTDAEGETGIKVTNGSLTLDGDFTLRGTTTGVDVGGDVSVKGTVRVYGGTNAIIHTGGMTLVPGFISTTTVEEYENGELTQTQTMPGIATGDGSAAHPFEISNSTHWRKVCEDVANGCATAGKHFSIKGGFYATEMMGTADNPFAGILDGGREYFTVHAGINESVAGAALFPYVSGATIRNLCVQGDIEGGAGSAGIVGKAISGATTLENCVFNGIVCDADGEVMNGNWILGSTSDGATATVSNCLDATNGLWGTTNAKAYTVTGTDVDLTLTGTSGLLWNNLIYAGEGDVVTFTTNGVACSASAGTFAQSGNECTLTMPDKDVAIINTATSDYTITWDTNLVGGRIQGRTTPAKAGWPVYVEVYPDDFYLLSEIIVTKVSSNPEASDPEDEFDVFDEPIFVDEDNIFQMPASNVKVSAVFVKKYDYNAETGVLELVCGDFNNANWQNNFATNEVPPADVKRVKAHPGVRFTGYCGSLFSQFTNCEEMDLSGADTEEMTSTENMFADCVKLTKLNLAGWNTSKVTDMNNMFVRCDKLGEIDLSEFVVNEGTNTNAMFDGTGVYKLTLSPNTDIKAAMRLTKGPNNARGWLIQGSDGQVVSTVAEDPNDPDHFTYAEIKAPVIASTVVKKKLPDNVVIELPDNEENSETIKAWHGVTTNVKLTGRTLYKDGEWNTLCLPFASGYTELSHALGDGYTRNALTAEDRFNSNGERYGGIWSGHNEEDYPYQTGYDESDGTLRLYFLAANDAMSAGTPFIIKWSKPENYVAYDGTNAETCSDIVNPTFNGVTIDKTMNPAISADGTISFTGTYDYQSFTAADKSILFLGTQNKLYYPQAGTDIGAFRAYFLLNGITAGDLPNHVKMLFGGITDGIRSMDNGKWTMDNEAGAWYDLSGRKIKDERLEMRDSHSSSIIHHPSSLKKGVYIHGGRKVVVK